MLDLHATRKAFVQRIQHAWTELVNVIMDILFSIPLVVQIIRFINRKNLLIKNLHSSLPLPNQ